MAVFASDDISNYLLTMEKMCQHDREKFMQKKILQLKKTRATKLRVEHT